MNWLGKIRKEKTLPDSFAPFAIRVAEKIDITGIRALIFTIEVDGYEKSMYVVDELSESLQMLRGGDVIYVERLEAALGY